MKIDISLSALTVPYAKENRKLSWFYTLSTLLILTLTLSATLILNHWSLQLISSVFSGLVIVRLFVIYHDYLHEAILKKSKLADILFTFLGYYLLTPKTIWRRSHNYHHNQNSKLFKTGIGSYPVFTKEKFDSLSPREKRKYLFLRHSLVIFLGYFFTFFYGMCIQSLAKGFKKHLDSLVALIVHFSLHSIILIYFGWEGTLFFTLIPHIISGGLGAYLFYAQHNFPDVQYNVDDQWTYEGAALESSSFLQTNQFMHWVTANIGFHHIHHLNARIPFYRLPEIMKDIEGLQHPKTTSLSFKDILACLRLKVWDEKQGKMVGVGLN